MEAQKSSRGRGKIMLNSGKAKKKNMLCGGIRTATLHADNITHFVCIVKSFTSYLVCIKIDR